MCDFLWSDPEEIEEWEANPRGAGVIFGTKIVDKFLQTNKFDLIVRAHQLIMEGYKLHFGNKLITIWSAPNYCYRCNNIAAILQLDENLKQTYITFNAAAEDYKPAPEKKPLPETTEAVFVFNDKKLNLKKYKYCYHKDIDFLENECAVLTHALKNLPIQILEIMPMRMRDFGKSAVHKDIFMGTLSSRGASNKISIKQSNIGNPQTTTSTRQHSKSSLIMSSAFSDYHRYQDD